MLRVLAPTFTPTMLDTLAELRIAVAWLDDAEPLVRERVAAVAEEFPNRRDVSVPRPDVDAVFMREVANVHGELYAEHADLYGENVAVKIERCLAVSDDEAAAAARRRDDYREELERVMAGFDLLLTPTLPIVAPPVEIGDLKLRGILTRNTLPVNALGWPALAVPCGPAEDGLPASVQLVGKQGDDALVLAAGARVAPLLDHA